MSLERSMITQSLRTKYNYEHVCIYISIMFSPRKYHLINNLPFFKLLDKGFRKEFFDVPGNIIDQLYKLYKRRPRYYFRGVATS